MFKDLVLKNRSYRGFDENVKLSNEQIIDLISLARISPSAANMQALKFYISNDSDTNDLIFPHTAWAGRIKKKLPYEGHRPTSYIVIYVDTNIVKDVGTCGASVGIAAQTIMLGATEIGFGGCMIGAFAKDKISEALKQSDNLVPVLILALGKPDETIEIVDSVNGDIAYYRDENDVHYVPKRALDELILNK